MPGERVDPANIIVLDDQSFGDSVPDGDIMSSEMAGRATTRGQDARGVARAAVPTVSDPKSGKPNAINQSSSERKSNTRNTSDEPLLSPKSREAVGTCTVIDADPKHHAPDGVSGDIEQLSCSEEKCETNASNDVSDNIEQLSASEVKCETNPADRISGVPVSRDTVLEALPTAGASNVVQLKDLKPNTSLPWAFIALVIAKNPVRHWKTWQDAGTLLEVYVTDSVDGCYRITLFNEAIAEYGDIVVPGNTCYFSGGWLKQPFTTSATVEISFGFNSDIRKTSNASTFVPQIATLCLADVAALNDDVAATTIAVVHGLGGLKRFVTKRGNATEKRELLLVDDSGFEIVCTAWGKLARDISAMPEGTILLLKGAVIGSYKNLRTASIGAGSDVIHEPALPRANCLREWYSSLSADHSFSRLSAL
ncbi:hypothetical protein DVH05_023378 [Phytophthora capsici]|nr:hypothetical protein DVH05_005890 [Phytophthora capsici]KAG1693613.1 hypothetical protein DVH05_023378 [Phytophthora capsici]